MKIQEIGPFTVLRTAIKAVPAMKYAVAVAGMGSVVAIVLGFRLKPEVAVFGILVVIGLMFAVAIFSSYVGEKTPATIGPATLLVWFYTLAIMVSTTLFMTSYFAHWPLTFKQADLLPGPVPVTMTVMYRDTTTPAAQVVLRLSKLSGPVIQELKTDGDGNAETRLPPGEYEVEAVGAEGKHDFDVSEPKTDTLFQVTRPKKQHTAAVLKITRVDLYPSSDKAQIQLFAFINGIKFRYPSLAGVEWMRVGPEMASEEFRLPNAAEYKIRFEMIKREGAGAKTKRYASQEELTFDESSDNFSYSLYDLEPDPKLSISHASTVGAEIHFSFVLK